MKQIWETRVSDTGDGKNEIAISLGDASVILDAIQLLEVVEQLVADRAKAKPDIPFQWANRPIKMDSMFRMAAGDLAAKGVTYDQDYVEVNLVRQTNWGLLQVKYDFDPSLEGITSAGAMSYDDTDWAVSRIKHFPDKQAFVQKMEAWGANQWPIFKKAFEEAEKG